MWSGSPALERKETRDEQNPLPLHNTEQHNASDGSPEADSTRVPSLQNVRESGTWGERDVGGPINEAQAMEDFEELRRNLTSLSKQQSRPSVKSRPSTAKSLAKIPSRGSARRTQTKETDVTEPGDEDVEAEEDFALDEFMRGGRFEKRIDDHSAKRIGVIYKNLTVKGIGAKATFVKTLPDAVIGTFGPDLYRLLCRFLPFLAFGNTGAKRTLIHDLTGVVRDGEMLLVLGRPGAGCSTFLKALANNRQHFEEVWFSFFTHYALSCVCHIA